MDNISLRNLAKYHGIFNNIHISHETIRKSLILTNNLFYVNSDLNLSGCYGYDVQWIRVERAWYCLRVRNRKNMWKKKLKKKKLK